jgi:hypothetical protein
VEITVEIICLVTYHLYRAFQNAPSLADSLENKIGRLRDGSHLCCQVQGNIVVVAAVLALAVLADRLLAHQFLQALFHSRLTYCHVPNDGMVFSSFVTKKLLLDLMSVALSSTLSLAHIARPNATDRSTPSPFNKPTEQSIEYASSSKEVKAKRKRYECQCYSGGG